MSGFFSRTSTDIKYLFTNSKKLTKKERKRKKRGAIALFGLFLAAFQLLISFLFVLDIIKLDILPMKYLFMLIVVLSLLWLYDFTAQFTKAHIWGKFLAVLLSAIMVFAYLVSTKLNDTLTRIDNNKTQIDAVDVIVLEDDKAQSINDVLTYTFGYIEAEGDESISKAIEKINKDYKATIKTVKYSSVSDMLDDLYANKKIQSILVNDTLRISYEETNQGFADKTRIIATIEVTTVVEVINNDKQVTEEPFIIYLSGNDTFGDIKAKGRSDVNILAVINPNTRQVLLVGTSRDYWVKMSSATTNKTGYDKLTHAGNDGPECSMDTLENLYGIDIDYYYKINITGCYNIVNALGGITVYSEEEFTSGPDAWTSNEHFVKGVNYLDGGRSIAFVRERHNLKGGELQRSRNHSAAIQGIINKITSPAILSSYSSLLDAVSDSFITNMPTSTITKLVKKQISDPTPWNIQSYTSEIEDYETLVGEVWGYNATYAIPDYDSVNTAITLINKTLNGEYFDVSDYQSK